MATSKKFSQLPAASSISNNDLAAIAHEDALAETGYESQKATMIQIGKKLLGDIEYVTDLPGFPSDEQNPFAALLYLRDSILNLLPIDEASGAVANFETEFALPLIDVKAEIKALETGTGAKSPSNPYVISGFTGMDLYQCGVNVLDEVFELGGIDYTTGEDTPASDRLRTKNYIPVQNADFYLYNGGSYTLAMCYYSASKAYLGSRAITTSKVLTYGTLDLPTGTAFIRIVITGQTTYSNNISLNYPSTKTDYIAYNPNSSIFPVSWQTEVGEVFGGEVDVTNGKLVVTHHGFTLTGAGEESWSVSNTGTANYFYVISLPTGSASAVGGSNIANIFPSVNIGNNSTTQGCYNTASAFRVRWGTEMTVADWKTWLETNNLTVVYKLATPIEYDLSDTANISALVGVNNVWSDTNGDTTVDYKLGIQAYIDKKIAEVQALVL